MRASIIDTAATLMYVNGVANTSLDDVLTQSGAGKSQLYHYFNDKADLVRAVVERQLELVFAAQPALQHLDSLQAIERWAEDVLRMHGQPGGPFACPLGSMAAELKNDPAFRPILDSAFRRWEKPIADGLRVMQARGELGIDENPDRLAATAIGALQGGMLLGRVANDVTPLRDLVDLAVTNIRSRLTT